MDFLDMDSECLNGNDPSVPDMNREVLETSVEGIAEWFTGAVLLVTGGTGFVGKALLEKLLRSCPGIETVYVLMRPKRGLSVEQRYKELLKNQVFDRIRSRWPERLEKLQPIAGDVSAPQLGVSPQQLRLLERVHTVFHSAATVRFTESLQTATALNVQGTATLLQLAADMPLLKVTPDCVRSIFQRLNAEPITRAGARVDGVQQRASLGSGGARVPPAVRAGHAAALRGHAAARHPRAHRAITVGRYRFRFLVREVPKLTPSLTPSVCVQGEHPNPYTLTKALAESIVNSHTELPVCIVRPSIVTAAFQEPFPGWIDNVYGVTGIIMEISRGTYRSGYCRERYVVDLVPVDILVNCCILAAWRQACKRPGHCPVYNVTSGSIDPLQWGNFTRLCVKWARENPTKYVMWYPNFSFTESRALNSFWEMSLHFLPAFLYDLALRAQGRKPIMMKIARRFKMAAATGEYFANHEWQFGVMKLLALHADAAGAADSAEFPAWPTKFSWEAYVGAYMLGIRRFILKDTLDSLPQARTKLNRSASTRHRTIGDVRQCCNIDVSAFRLYWVHRVLQAVTGYYLFRLLARLR
ncbi:unnamed protein product [Leptosia nina]|uniref:Fatty acyl-CoA reductase n=1 Tax=Leptosia nina TaxID=320188 RepID=A0AAV1JA91_9NEOP